MPEPPTVKARLSPEAEADLEEVLNWSETHFGSGAAVRYAELIIQALRDLQADPQRPGAHRLKGLHPDIIIYHLASSRRRVAGKRVKTPRHFILCRFSSNDVLDVIRILHDSRDLLRHMPND